ncbi:hypothetical protein V6N13_017770 [Hibiscus sabdariffa]|uniref:Uncharacterized protein n=1 Tax=Hibiscus sabdariffa TaxID=183260 RepID=A0ABR2CHK6_9ROSI
MQRTGSEGRIQKLPRHKAERPCRCILRLSAVGFRTEPRAAAGYTPARLGCCQVQVLKDSPALFNHVFSQFPDPPALSMFYLNLDSSRVNEANLFVDKEHKTLQISLCIHFECSNKRILFKMDRADTSGF